MPLQLQKMKIDWRQSVVLTQLRQALLHHVCNIRMQDQATGEGDGNVSWRGLVLSHPLHPFRGFFSGKTRHALSQAKALNTVRAEAKSSSKRGFVKVHSK